MCFFVVKLSNKLNKPFELTNWEKHRDKGCDQIRGTVKGRTERKTDVNGNVTYGSKETKVTKSIAHFFAVQTKPAKQPPPIVPESFICKHLHGPDYSNYINLTHTRAYGGISPTFTAQLVRCLFPYKTFPPLDSASAAVKDGLLVSLDQVEVMHERW
ncbi:hypothetical protein BDN72DRAFT_905938 [Pluteus cervinus]|uniref:Uncharacterized protein n=1 Tax=Pluteus cervinus TaxID=181527 RepID=A0ACD3A3B8_9AGAR|nr:hypothetical protein BDN72DRAFT_905938 [Pluteus cervinus]